MTTEPTIVHDPDRCRYEIHVDGQLAGHARYAHEADALVFDHTEIDDEYEGQGLGGKLARGALDAVRADGRRIIARCPFIRGWIEDHPEYADLLVS